MLLPLLSGIGIIMMILFCLVGFVQIDFALKHGYKRKALETLYWCVPGVVLTLAVLVVAYISAPLTMRWFVASCAILALIGCGGVLVLNALDGPEPRQSTTRLV